LIPKGVTPSDTEIMLVFSTVRFTCAATLAFLMITVAPTAASKLRGKNGSSAEEAARPTKAYGFCKEGLCDSLEDQLKMTVHVASRCTCTATMEGDCACEGCEELEQLRTCSELLGPCSCSHWDNAICDCGGYCHTRERREEACEAEPGCQWTGQWCEAQIGILWD